jgi:restriction endonuclease
VRDVIELGTWTQPAAFVAVCATLLLLYLRFRPAKTGEVRLGGAARPKARAGRAWGPFWQGRSTGLPERFERMDGAEFEAEVSELLRGLGYIVRPTPPANIHDVDLLLQMSGCRVAVQLKKWNAPVGDRSVYGLFTGRIHYGTDEAWLITTSRFTPKALKLAETTGVRLVDGDELAEWLRGHREEGKDAEAQKAIDERMESV